MKPSQYFQGMRQESVDCFDSDIGSLEDFLISLILFFFLPQMMALEAFWTLVEYFVDLDDEEPEIIVVDIYPGDKILLKCKGTLTPENLASLKEAFKQAYDSANKTIVIDENIEFFVLRNKE